MPDAAKKWLEKAKNAAWPDDVDIVEAQSIIRRLLEQNEGYEWLKRAVNENSGECLPECDSYGHAEGCEYVSMSATMVIQQKKIASLLAENERLEATVRGYRLDRDREEVSIDQLEAENERLLAKCNLLMAGHCACEACIQEALEAEGDTCNYCKRTPDEAKGGYKCSTCGRGGE